MTFGQKLKKLRAENGYTQRDLAERLHVTFQTVSKWEKDENEPDFTTLKELTKILNCSVEYLFSDEEETEPNQPEPEEKPESEPEPTTPLIGQCHDCGKDIHQGETVHHIETRSPGGTLRETLLICDDCLRKKEEAEAQRIRQVEESTTQIQEAKNAKSGVFHKITDHDDGKPLFWGIFFGVATLIAVLIVCIVNVNVVGVPWTIFAPLLSGYTVTATIYCIFTASYVSDIFMEVASWSIHFPGLIFTWSLDGIKWLIMMKLLFAVLGFLAGVAIIALAFAVSAVFSIFSFIPLLIRNRA